MTTWLIKKVISDYENVEDLSVRASYGILSSMVGLICNMGLFLGKLSVGFFCGSVAIMADAFNNLSDAGASVIGFFGAKLANKPADKNHPFGHGRVEYIAALIVSFLILQVGFLFFKESIEKIRTPRMVSFQVWGIVFLFVSVGVKLWLAYFHGRLAKRVDSKVMKATAMDSLGDALVTAVTILSLFYPQVGGWSLDGILGMVVSVFIMVAGVEIAKTTIEPLIGEAIDVKEQEKVVEFIASYEGVLGIHDLIIHHYGPGRNMASVHVEVSNQMDIEEAHHMIDEIERDILKQKGLYLVIHMDPVETENEAVLEIKEKVEKMIHTLESEAEIHDFRVIEKEEQLLLRFDMVVPHRYDTKGQEELKKRVEGLISLLHEGYGCEITVERSFVAESN